MNENQIKKLLDACFGEFCNIVGDTPCGCDACPYGKYNTDENETNCAEEYRKDKLKSLQQEGKEQTHE